MNHLNIIYTLLLIFLALIAYFSVLYVSSKDLKEGAILAIIIVWQFPPKESFNKRVNLESRYVGFLPSARALIQLPRKIIDYVKRNHYIYFLTTNQCSLPRASKDRFIFAPSLKRMPLHPVAAALSDPARSIIDNFTIFTWLVDCLSVILT